MMISPTRQVADWPATLDDKILLFQEWIRDWQLEIANLCLQHSSHAGFAALSIVASYFEMVAKYRAGYIGNDRSKAFFKQGLEEVVPGLPNMAKDVLYERVRCSLYHVGMVRGSVVILTKDHPAPIGFHPQLSMVAINPNKLVARLIEHFTGYIAELKDPTKSDLRIKFEQRFNSESLPPQQPSPPASLANLPNTSINITNVQAWASGGIAQPGDPGTITP